MSRRHLLLLTGIALAALTIALGVLIWHKYIQSSRLQDGPSNYVTASEEQVCNIETDDFVKQVNLLRSSKGIAPVIYTGSGVANSRIRDMELHSYYGHTNPQNYHNASFYIPSIDPKATSWGEVLDGPNNASDAFSDFANSPEHYDIMMDPQYNAVQIASVYWPNSFPNYDYQGNLISPAGKYYSKCLVVGVFLRDN